MRKFVRNCCFNNGCGHFFPALKITGSSRKEQGKPALAVTLGKYGGYPALKVTYLYLYVDFNVF